MKEEWDLLSVRELSTSLKFIVVLVSVSVASPVATDHHGLHSGKVEGAQVSREPRCPSLQVPTSPVLLPPSDRDYCVSHTNVILKVTFFFRESLRSRDLC